MKREPRLESEIQDAIRLELGNVAEYPELWLARNNVGQRIADDGSRLVYGVGGKGAADLIGIWRHPDARGQFVAIEVKRAKTKQTEEQLVFQRLVESRGGVYVVLRSVDEARKWAREMRSKAA